VRRNGDHSAAEGDSGDHQRRDQREKHTTAMREAIACGSWRSSRVDRREKNTSVTAEAARYCSD
jgi:hypothetical protein